VVEILVIQEVWKAREKHIYSIEQLETKKWQYGFQTFFVKEKDSLSVFEHKK
jgi:hypothetical protein